MIHKRKKRRPAKLVLFYALIFLCTAFTVAAQRATHNLRVKAYVLSSSGQTVRSPDFKARNTLGQPTPIGTSFSPGFRVTAGLQPITMQRGAVLTAETGDINGDGSIDVLDIVVVVNHILGTQTLTGEALDRANCNGDDVIDILDALSIVNVILGYIPGCPGADFKPVVTQEVREFFKSLQYYLTRDEYAKFTTLFREHVEIPTEYSLGQNYPNPFNPTTDIRYQIPDVRSPIHTTLKIYNVLGQEVRTLVDMEKEPGYYAVTWNGRDNEGRQAASGVYFYRLTAGDYTATRRMVLMK
ncbi:MAG: T9SS type A sorting domain-containing protein [Gemmatimonadota bacterium]|nr:MAG: T9SS type A sorting domain-containing protein [Gemmatimonadota bacterium]